MPSVLIIAEKPDQGAKLAAPFTHMKKQGYIELAPQPAFPQGAIMTWAVGHLCELVPPEEYDSRWKKWSLTTLPIIPEKFQHRVIRGRGKQFQVVKKWVNDRQIQEIIIAGDAEREGEAIIRILLQKCNNKKPMKRLWISSLTPKSVTNGFATLLDEKETRSFYYEAMARACADWMVGINVSRAYTLLLQKYGIKDVFSAGRVQTPTLSLIVRREKEILNFKPEIFYEVLAHLQFDEHEIEAKWIKDGNTRLKEREEAEEIVTRCQEKEAQIDRNEKERKQYKPPFLYNLSSLQADANRIFKFSPKKTLDTAQKLYVKGIISYPRSDSSFVTKEEAATFPELLTKFSKLGQYQPLFPVPNPSIKSNHRYVNEKKVTDHYAIIPTEQVKDPSKLNADEEKIYDLIIRRFLAAHYDDAVFDYTTIYIQVGKQDQFIVKGKEMINEGWRKVIFQSKETDGDVILPSLSDHQTGKVTDIKIKDGKTEPPKRFTEGQLITLMKTAGKYLEDQELIKVLKKTEGLGTEATRAGIITLLKDRNYITVSKNQVYPTEKGMLLIDAMGDSLLASPEMTAKWEQRLHEIGEGKVSPTGFIDQAKKLSVKLIEDATVQSNHWNFQDVDLSLFQSKSPKRGPATPIGPCKKCDGSVIDKGSFYGCSNYQKNKCGFTLSKTILRKKIPEAQIKKILTGGTTDIIKGFKKGEKTFDAKLNWNENEKRVNFFFE